MCIINKKSEANLLSTIFTLNSLCHLTTPITETLKTTDLTLPPTQVLCARCVCVVNINPLNRSNMSGALPCDGLAQKF